jgi:hypothetical protein
LVAGPFPIARIVWPGAAPIVRSLYPPIDLFEDIADPADWPLLISAEMKSNPRLIESIGNLDLVPPARRVGGVNASWLMAPFTHPSPDRPSRFSDGTYGVLYAGQTFEVALLETMHHHGRFMAATSQAPGWTSQFREILLDVGAALHDLRSDNAAAPVLAADSHTAGQALGAALRAAGSDGVVYPSVRRPGGECVGLFYPDLAARPLQARHLDYHWDGERVDLYRDAGTRQVYRVVES